MSDQFEALITAIKDNRIQFTIIDKEGFIADEDTPIQCLLEKNIKCEAGTIFLVTISEIKREFFPWAEDRKISKKLMDQLVMYYEEIISDLTGFLADRMLEYGKWKDIDNIIEPIIDAIIFFKDIKNTGLVKKVKIHAGENINKDPISVKHSELRRPGGYDGVYRSICPVCENGTLLVGRDQETFKLLAEDNCILCAQRFIYSDIEEIGEFK